MIKRILLFLLFGGMALTIQSQQFDIENVRNIFGKGKPLKLNGGIHANTIGYEGSDDAGRDPFTYYLTGNVNLNIYNQVNLPFTFSLTNAGSAYQLPSVPNRLSLHPTYRWITGHIGDVSMSFSPYTLNGHLFSGIGVDLAPGTDWECNIMYGRLQKAVAYDEMNPAFLPAYKRMGYGAKVGWKKKKAGASFNFFTAKDDLESLAIEPDSLGITPLQNLSGSLLVFINPLKQMELRAEYALSLWTNDMRSPEERQQGILNVWPESRMSSSCYDAVNVQLSYIFPSSRIGVGYERIDPGYKTLGAYYFSNDLENITLNAAQSLFSNKLNLSFNIGYQHDNLANDKMNATSRFVGSMQVNTSFSKSVSANLSYSNFQTYTNVRSNFELINRVSPFENMDTLNYVQLSQSAQCSLNLITRQSENQLHHLNFNCTYQDAADKQGGVYRPGSVNSLVNASSAYHIVYPASGWSVNAAGNFCYNTIRGKGMITWGPTIGNGMKFFKKKVSVSNAVSYNLGRLSGNKQSEVFLFRMNASYNPYKRQNINCAYNYQWRWADRRGITYSSLVMVGYSYNF